ncbi:hypothetical protein Hanom_Chr07g00602601 [Helianthus anomalus]
MSQGLKNLCKNIKSWKYYCKSDYIQPPFPNRHRCECHATSLNNTPLQQIPRKQTLLISEY